MEVLWSCQEKTRRGQKHVLAEGERGALSFYLKLLVFDLLGVAKYLLIQLAFF